MGAENEKFEEDILESTPLMQLNATGKSSNDTDFLFDYVTSIFILYLKKLWSILHIKVFKSSCEIDKAEEISPQSEELYDWWMKYRHAVKKIDARKSAREKRIFLSFKRKIFVNKQLQDEAEVNKGPIVIYHGALEDQPEFKGFTDVFKSYEIHGKNVPADRQSLYNSTFIKITLCIYKWPVGEEYVTVEGVNPISGVLSSLPYNKGVQVLVRVYAVQAYNLHPSDPDGKADPFIEISTNSKTVSDAKNYIPKQLNPVFGRCLELVAVFPVDSLLTVKVIDWDRFSVNDLIGETIIDIENRFYSCHRATCGLPAQYVIRGYNKWRDIQNPSDILANLCEEYNLHAPIYLPKSVIVAKTEFKLMEISKHSETKEKLALLVLNKWSEIPLVGCHLVPEHVETRPLYNKKFPGVEQGKLEMWVDLFDLSLGVPPDPIDITPQKPTEYELRIIILNTADVKLVDDSLFDGEKHSDIYVKGWISEPSESQTTDVHFWSLTGEGNFNWRFIFNFVYFSSEECMLIKKKDIFAIDYEDNKVPAILYLQVWDNDRFSADDFIGSLALELSRMPRGAKYKKKCKAPKTMDSRHYINLFKVKRAQGWWPFTAGYHEDSGQSKITGYVEADIQLLTIDEAIKYPAGLGRSAPDALPEPNRPVHKFNLWMTPFKMARFIICKINRKVFIIYTSVAVCVLFLLVAFYSLPVFIVKRIIGA